MSDVSGDISSTKKTKSGAGTPARKKTASGEKAKLSYKDQRELGNLPGKIEKLEQQQSDLETQMAAPGFYQSDYEQVQTATRKLAEVQKKLEQAYDRWSELESNK